ncbi:MAG: MerR family transcriptional regulator [Bacteroidales bacterium]|nr:MerR family transcriptional regulator [Bacteroidales bacterium]
MDTQNKDKLYYTIGEVAGMFDVNVSLIRYWENQFSILKPKKNKKGNRLFTPKDIDNLHLIYHLVKERKLTLEGAKLKLKENKEDTFQNFEVVKKLKNIKTMLLEIRDSI